MHFHHIASNGHHVHMHMYLSLHAILQVAAPPPKPKPTRYHLRQGPFVLSIASAPLALALLVYGSILAASRNLF